MKRALPLVLGPLFVTIGMGWALTLQPDAEVGPSTLGWLAQSGIVAAGAVGVVIYGQRMRLRWKVTMAPYLLVSVAFIVSQAFVAVVAESDALSEGTVFWNAIATMVVLVSWFLLPIVGFFGGIFTGVLDLESRYVAERALGQQH